MNTQNQKVGVCHYPTRIVLVDDNKNFLETMHIQLGDEFPCLFYDDPQKALHFLNNEYKSDAFINRCLLSEDDSTSESVVIDFNFRRLYQEIYNDHRSNEITVLIVDYSMAGMSGLELFKQLKSKSIMKILLTGEASKELAIEAFNADLIDKFILKTTPNMTDVLRQSIQELQGKCFLRWSDLVLNKIQSARQTLNILEDVVFINFFNKVCENYKIVEYYLLDDQGSFLLLDLQAKPIWLIVKSDKEMDELYRYAEFEGDTPKEVLELLKNRHMLPYFHTEEELQVSPTHWKEYMYPATKLQSNKHNFYYAIVTHLNAYQLNINKILSSQAYLRDN